MNTASTPFLTSETFLRALAERLACISTYSRSFPKRPLAPRLEGFDEQGQAPLVLDVYDDLALPRMAIKKSELYRSLWSSCDELRGGMDATSTRTT
jgi:hypothetical protein